MAQRVERCDDLKALLALALKPRQLYRAQLSYDERTGPARAGFSLNDRFPRPGAGA